MADPNRASSRGGGRAGASLPREPSPTPTTEGAVNPDLISFLANTGADQHEPKLRPFFDRIINNGLENALDWLNQRDAMAEATGHPYYPVTNPTHEGAINYLMQSPVLDTFVTGAERYMQELGEGTPEAQALRRGLNEMASYVGETAGGYLDPRTAQPGRSTGEIPGMEDVPGLQVLLQDAGLSAIDLFPLLMKGSGGVRGFTSPTRGDNPVPVSFRGYVESMLAEHNQEMTRRATQAVPEAVEGINTATGSFERTLPDVAAMIFERVSPEMRDYLRNDPDARGMMADLDETVSNALRSIYVEGRGGMEGASGRAATFTQGLEDDLIQQYSLEPDLAADVANEVFRRAFGAGRRLANDPGQGVRRAAQDRGVYAGHGGATFDPFTSGMREYAPEMMPNLAPEDYRRTTEIEDMIGNARSRVIADSQGRSVEPLPRLPRDYDRSRDPMGSRYLRRNPEGGDDTGLPPMRLFDNMDDDEVQEVFRRIAGEGEYRSVVGPEISGDELTSFIRYAEENRDDPAADWTRFQDDLLSYRSQGGIPLRGLEDIARRHGIPLGELYQVTDLDGRVMLDPARLEAGTPRDAMSDLRQSQVQSGSRVEKQIENALAADERERLRSGEELIRQANDAPQRAETLAINARDLLSEEDMATEENIIPLLSQIFELEDELTAISPDDPAAREALGRLSQARDDLLARAQTLEDAPSSALPDTPEPIYDDTTFQSLRQNVSRAMSELVRSKEDDVAMRALMRLGDRMRNHGMGPEFAYDEAHQVLMRSDRDMTPERADELLSQVWPGLTDTPPPPDELGDALFDLTDRANVNPESAMPGMNRLSPLGEESFYDLDRRGINEALTELGVSRSELSEAYGESSVDSLSDYLNEAFAWGHDVSPLEALGAVLDGGDVTPDQALELIRRVWGAQ